MESYMMVGFRELNLEVASLKNLYHIQNQNQGQSSEEEREGEEVDMLTWGKVTRISLCVLCYYVFLYAKLSYCGSTFVSIVWK
jgi:hypothetical protein